MAIVNGTANADVIHLAGDTLTGLDGYFDMDRATAGNDCLFGLGGDDVLRGGAGVDHISGGEGLDQLVVIGPQDLAVGETYYGGNGQDALIGLEMDQAVSLDGIGLLGIEGLLGFDAGISLKLSQLTQFSYLNTGTIHILTGGTIGMTDVLVRTQAFVLSDLGNHVSLSSDPIAGQDYTGFAGVVVGGAGNDWVSVQSDDSLARVAGPREVLLGMGGDDWLQVYNRWAVLLGGEGNDTLLGGDYATRLIGGAGDDQDWYMGGTARCLIQGGRGRDLLDLGHVMGTFDLTGQRITGFEAIYVNDRSDVTMTRAQLAQFHSISNQGITRLADSGVVDLTGVQFAEIDLHLAAGDDTLTLESRAGRFHVVIHGEEGDDRMSVTNGSPHRLRPWAELWGDAGNDRLTGAKDRDVLHGGAGDDVLTGRAGKDLFYFDQTDAGGTDIITDFDWVGPAGDRFVFAGGTLPVYLGDGGFTGAGVQARFNGAGLDVDLDGDGSRDLVIWVRGMHAAADLTQDDFQSGVFF